MGALTEEWTCKGSLILCGHDYREVGQMQDTSPGPVGDGLNYQRARLAAAAPDLYRAVKLLRAFIASGSTEDEERYAAMTEAEAALGAAEGES